MILTDEITFDIEDEGLLVRTDGPDIRVRFDPSRFRPSEVPILFSDITKVKKLGYQVKYQVLDIIRDQMNFFMDAENRCVLAGSESESRSMEKKI